MTAARPDSPEVTGGDLGGLSWRILVDGPLHGAANMARDHALAELVGHGEAVLRLYRWSPATLSLGRNEPFGEIHRRLLASRPDVGVVRRPTGGRAVLHDHELTYGVAAPVSAFGGLRAAYRSINRALVEGLGRLGVAARLAGPGALPSGAGVCFADSAEGEVVAGGRKLVGSAQRRIGGAFLQHGSLLLDDDQGALLASAAEDPGAEASSPWIISREHRERRSAPLARRDEAVRGCARASTERGEAPGWQGALRGAWRSHSPKKQRRARRSSTDAASLECRQGAFCGPQGLVAALPARGATQSEAAQRGCSAARMPGEVCPRAARAGPATLADLLGAVPPWPMLTTALADGFGAVLGGSWQRAAMTPAEVALSDRLLARYYSREWTRRREE